MLSAKKLAGSDLRRADHGANRGRRRCTGMILDRLAQPPLIADPEPSPCEEAADAAPATLVERARRAAAAETPDVDGAFPGEGVRALHAAGLLLAPFPAALGGDDLAVGSPARLMAVLAAVGRGDLALGRLYEGHVNAVGLAIRYGSPANLRRLLGEAMAGRIGGVWMAGEPLRLTREDGRLVLAGSKILCSGCGHVRRPLVAAEHDGASVMLLPAVPSRERTDLSGWTMRGMRGSATGTVDFSGIVVEPDDILGQPGDYLRSPYFRGGAWRVLAVQLGGVEAVLDLYKAQLRRSPHRDNAVQLARFGAAAIAAETARLWVARAGALAEGPVADAEMVDAYVDLARNAFETVALEVVACAEKAIGLKAFTRPNRLERVARDLQTYLRQPALDASLLSAAAFHLGRDA